jgi:hypothetical protein
VSLQEDSKDLRTLEDFIKNVAKPLPPNSPLILNAHLLIYL